MNVPSGQNVSLEGQGAEQNSPTAEKISEDTIAQPSYAIIFANTDCDCLVDSECDEAAVFIKKIDGSSVRDKDFTTYSEKGREPETDDCDGECGIRGISINRLTTEAQLQQILQVYKDTLNIKPNGKTKYIRFTIATVAGRYKHTPTEHAENHHDFYKADGFSTTRINVIETGPVS